MKGAESFLYCIYMPALDRSFVRRRCVRGAEKLKGHKGPHKTTPLTRGRTDSERKRREAPDELRLADQSNDEVSNHEVSNDEVSNDEVSGRRGGRLSRMRPSSPPVPPPDDVIGEDDDDVIGEDEDGDRGYKAGGSPAQSAAEDSRSDDSGGTCTAGAQQLSHGNDSDNDSDEDEEDTNHIVTNHIVTNQDDDGISPAQKHLGKKLLQEEIERDSQVRLCTRKTTRRRLLRARERAAHRSRTYINSSSSAHRSRMSRAALQVTA